jgi:S-adenosylmethionine:tRNA ribosyltransferase-isomerase
MRLDVFNYELPPELIAQRPADDREAARLLHVLPRRAPELYAGSEGASADESSAFEERTIAELPSLLPAGALVVLNDTRVIPARLLGKKSETGGRVEIFLVRRIGTRSVAVVAEEPAREVEVWRALGKASKPLRFTSDVVVGEGRLVVRLVARAEDDGLLEVLVWSPSGEPIDDAIRACGHVPLPPYIKRDDDERDTDRYQTVFARVDGAIAAPTAGLHMTRALLGRLAVHGCEVSTVTLHVGLGTFQPVTVEDLDQHRMHAESYRVSRTTADAIASARSRGAPVVAVGTTVARALESAADPDSPGLVHAGAGETRILIQPGYSFRVVDTLLTNFHLPRSTLLAMVCAFAGTTRVLAAYERAVRDRFRFFSYGDAMLVHREGAS